METLEQISERIVRQNVYCCMSHIVATLANGAYALPMPRHSSATDSADELGNLAEQAYELAAPIDDWEEAAIQAGWEQFYDKFQVNCYRDKNDGATWSASDWQDLCAAQGIEPYQREVFEHWAVTDWLADELIKHGEKVDKDFGSLCVWARTTTGQMISGDSVILRIARESSTEDAEG